MGGTFMQTLRAKAGHTRDLAQNAAEPFVADALPILTRAVRTRVLSLHGSAIEKLDGTDEGPGRGFDIWFESVWSDGGSSAVLHP